MFSIKLICVVFATLQIILVEGSTSMKDDSATIPHNTNVNETSRCGGILTATSGVISYKAGNETVLENERCVWIVAVPQAKGYTIYPSFLGFQPGDENQRLTIVGITRQTIWHWPISTHYFPTTVGEEILVENANLLTITFSSGSIARNNTNNSGFTLTYVSTEEGNALDVNPNSRHEILSSETALNVRHPPSGQYGLNETSIFIFPPTDNIYHDNIKRTIVYKRIELESCLDNVSFYYFNYTSSHYHYITTLCNATDFKVYDWNDIFVVVFTSDHTVTKQGFDLISLTNSVC